MTEVTERPRIAAPAHEGLLPQDHDLPILAFEQYPRPRVDWEPYVEEGFGPALILGAERRLHGFRARR